MNTTEHWVNGVAESLDHLLQFPIPLGRIYFTGYRYGRFDSFLFQLNGTSRHGHVTNKTMCQMLIMIVKQRGIHVYGAYKLYTLCCVLLCASCQLVQLSNTVTATRIQKQYQSILYSHLLFWTSRTTRVLMLNALVFYSRTLVPWYRSF